MGKKKKSPQKSSSKAFSNSPFKSLKGLSALEQEDKVNNSCPSDSIQTNHSGDQGSDENSFADEMNFLGVQPLSGRSIEEDVSSAQDVTNRPQVKSDQDEFLEAVGSIEKVFKDEWPDEEDIKRAVPRRMKQVERGQLKPQDELDLHGLTVEEATVKVKFFLQNSIYNGFHTVIIVTGKGLHSDEGPVLRKALDPLLGSLNDLVVEWGVAPRRYGGDGALIVFLRKSG